MIHKQSNILFPTKYKRGRGNIEEDIRYTCAIYFIDPEEIRVRSSEQRIVVKRTKIMRIIKKQGYSYNDIGRYFNITPQAVGLAIRKKDN